MVVVAHVADAHLGHALRGLSAREEAVYETFERLIEAVEEHSPDVVLIAGDLFEHHRPKPRAMRLALETLDELRKGASARIVAVSGNHEIVQRRGFESPLRVLEAAGVLDHLIGGDSLTLDVGGIRVHIAGHHWLRPDQLKELLPKRLRPDPEADVNVALLHLALEGTLPSPRETLGPNAIPRGFDYYALGHVHEPDLRLELHGSPACYPGSPEPRTFKEAEKRKRGFMLVEFDGDDPNVTFVPVEWSRTIAVVKIENASRWREEIASEVAGLKDAVVKVIVKDPRAGADLRREIESYLETAGARSAIVEVPEGAEDGPSGSLARLLHNALTIVGERVDPEELERALSSVGATSLGDIHSNPEKLAERLGLDPETVAEAARLASGTADPTAVVATAAGKVASSRIEDLDPKILTEVALKILEADSPGSELIDELTGLMLERSEREAPDRQGPEEEEQREPSGDAGSREPTTPPESEEKRERRSEGRKPKRSPGGFVTLDSFIDGG